MPVRPPSGSAEGLATCTLEQQLLAGAELHRDTVGKCVSSRADETAERQSITQSDAGAGHARSIFFPVENDPVSTRRVDVADAYMVRSQRRERAVFVQPRILRHGVEDAVVRLLARADGPIVGEQLLERGPAPEAASPLSVPSELQPARDKGRLRSVHLECRADDAGGSHESTRIA